MRRSLGRIRHRRADVVRLTRAVSATSPYGRVAVPRVTVVIATYNRSNVLRYALESIIGQTVGDWEALVVGDNSSDDSATVVDSLADPRIRFVDLSHNTGDQSGPNSVGQRLARGELIAFLSQDDLWFPDHLERLISRSEVTGAQLVIARILRVSSMTIRPDEVLEATVDEIVRPLDEPVEPHESFVASGLLVSARLARRVGDWRVVSGLRYSSTHDFVYRCWSSGGEIARCDVPTVVVIPSIVAPNSYPDRRDAEQVVLAPLVLAGMRQQIDAVTVRRAGASAFITTGEVDGVERQLGPVWRRIAPHAGGIFRRTYRITNRLGFSPWEYRAALLGVSRGALVSVLRRQRGMPSR